MEYRDKLGRFKKGMKPHKYKYSENKAVIFNLDKEVKIYD